MENKILHLTNPATDWENASPVGNGSCGMMIHGGVATDKITLNEETIWSRNPAYRKQSNISDKIKHLRRLFLENKPYEANEWLRENVTGYGGVKNYEYAGEIVVSLNGDDVSDGYRRDIDLIHGVCKVGYRKDGIRYEREYFASLVNGLLCARYTASDAFGADISIERENMTSLSLKGNEISMTAVTAFDAREFAATVRINTDGRTSITQNKLRVEEATYIEIYTAICTRLKHENYERRVTDMLSAAEAGWDSLIAESSDKFASYMTRSDIRFDNVDPTLEQMPVSERLARLTDDPTAHDTGLVSLYWQFGKYLLVASSCPDAWLPANLQGVWATGLVSPWHSDYHTNINLQMNYWHAEQAGLGDCATPLFRYMNEYLLPAGKEAAKSIYGTRGMVVHHLSDIYGFADIADGPWGLWPLGGAWLAYHMWEHYLYTEDADFLRNTAYEYIREATLFWVDNLFEDENGTLHTGPSTSPENEFYVEVNGEKKKVFNTISPTMDVEVVTGLFDFYVETENILGIDPELARTVAEKRAKMLPLRIGKHGQLMEWICDYEEVEPGHRHISHAFALYPAAQITRWTPELYNAIRVTLERRLAFGGGHTGWSRAWLINLFARLGDGEGVYDNIRLLFTKSTAPNLLDVHPPFQIDGNFGGAAGIGEMLMQSHEGVISLLPAVSVRLSDGSFRGLRARGGIEVSAMWANGSVTRAELVSDTPRNVTVEFENGERQTVYVDGKTVIER